MCNQMLMSEKGSGNFEDLEKTQVKIFPHFSGIPFFLPILILKYHG